MIKLYDGGVFLREGTEIVPEAEAAARAKGCVRLQRRKAKRKDWENR